MNKKNEAINLFKEKYDGKTPKEFGLPVIGIYEKQSAFLYAVSEDVIAAYKTQQNIIRWLMVWFMGPLAATVLVWVIVSAKYQDYGHPLCIVVYTFWGIWTVLLGVLWFKVKQTDRIIKLGDNITFLNY